MKIQKYVSEPAKIYSRALAKLLDYLFFYWCLVLPFFFTEVFSSDLFHLLSISLVPTLFVPIEALLLTMLGTTPGKALFGIVVKNEKGKNLSYFQALKRSFLCLVSCGFNLPVIQLVFLIIQKYKLEKNAQASWDKLAKSAVLYRKKRSLRLIFSSVFIIIFSGLTYLEYELKEVVSPSRTSLLSTEIFKKGETPWVTFVHPEGLYNIDFPKDPEVISSKLPIPRSKDSLPLYEAKYITESEVEYSLSYTTLPKKWLRFSPGLVLKGALKVICSNTPGAKIFKKSAQTYKAQPALEFVFKKNGEKESLGRLVLVDDVLYKLEVSYPLEKKEEIQEHLNLFLQSFDPKPVS